MRRAFMLAGIAGSLVACGDDGSSLSAAEYRQRADEICRSAAHEREAVPRSLKGRERAERVGPTSRNRWSEFSALEPPPELAADHRALVASKEQGDRLLREIAEALGNDLRARRSTRRPDELRRELIRLGRRDLAVARRLGISRDCGDLSGWAADPA